MSCQAPPARWRAGLLRPVNAVLWIAGVLCVAVGIVVTDGVAGLLPQVGGVLFLLGTSGGAVSAHGLGSLLTLVNGSRARVDDLTKECTDMKPLMQNLANLLCVDHDAAQLAIDTAIFDVSRTWTRGRGPGLELYVLCRTIAIARLENDLSSQRAAQAADPEIERRVIRTLRELCHVPAPQIASMLDLQLDQVQNVLAGPARGRRP